MACLVRPNFVSITPDNGYYDSDGCYEVVLQGHHLGTAASATIGGAEITSLAAAENNPDIPEQSQDVGFLYTGFAPASATGEPGWADVTLTVDGEKLTIKDGWYYKSCPTSFQLDTVTLPGGTTTPTAAPAAIGDTIAFEGCGLTEDVTVEILDPTGVVAARTPPTTPPLTNALCDAGTVAASIPLTVDCGGAQAHIEIPELPAGSYTVRVVHSDGYIDAGPCGVDSGDTGVSCDCYAFDLGGAK